LIILTLKVLIVDDESPARNEMRYLLEKYDYVQIVGEAANAREAMLLIHALEYSIVFLDIAMPGLNGLDLCKAINETPYPPLVVFVTAHEEYAIEAFGVNAVDYLLKPIDPRRLDKTMAKVLQLTQASAPAKTGTPKEIEEKRKSLGLIPVEHKGKTILVDEKNIIYLYADNDYTFIKTNKEKYLTRFTLKDLERRLNPHLFFRCHRSYLINIKKAREVVPMMNGTLILVVDDTEKSEVPVSRSQAKTIRSLLGM
jgi:two-component system LytT family response regulator/two-component system response regulator LytT